MTRNLVAGLKAAIVVLVGFPLFLGAEEVVLSDFVNKTVPFAYGSWLDESSGQVKLQCGPNGMETTEGATAKGGACDRVALKVSGDNLIELTFVVLDGNSADGISVLLEDGDGTQAGWHFSIAGLDVGESRVFVSDEIASPNFTNPTGVPLDLENIVSWHVQGDHSSDLDLRVRFERLSIKPPN